MLVPLYLLLVVIGTAARELSDEEYSRLPPLFHLDDYSRCLAQKDGLYCLGSFHLTPAKLPHPTYDLIKEYTKDPFTFNRTFIHRGYCVSARCKSADRNATQRFERCVTQWGRAHALRTRLHTLHYCRTHLDNVVHAPDAAQRIFIQVIYLLLLINSIGTAYDVVSGDTPNKNKLLMTWSIPANWQRLTATYEGGDPRLAKLSPVQGVKTVSMFPTMYAHAVAFHYGVHLADPKSAEQMMRSNFGAMFANGTSVINMFIMISCFLTAYNMLLHSQKSPLNLHMLPLLIIKRIIRITPVSLLMVGYAATWWPYARSGPLLSTTIGENCNTCRRKFWAHALFLNNIVDKHDICLMPTWFLAVDMHLYILSCFLTIFMWRMRRLAIPLYATLFVVTSLLNVGLAYINDWKPLVYFSTPEYLRTIFHGEESFSHFYMSSWGSLPVCFMGLLLAHLHYELQEKGINYAEYKWLVYAHKLSLPIAFAWFISMGSKMRLQTSPIINAGFTAVDRPLVCSLLALMLFGTFNIDSGLRRFFGWHGWRILGRMSLPVMLIHWCINQVIVARPILVSSNYLEITADWLTTVFFTYAVALPVTLLVEIPVQRLLTLLV